MYGKMSDKIAEHMNACIFTHLCKSLFRSGNNKNVTLKHIEFGNYIPIIWMLSFFSIRLNFLAQNVWCLLK